MTKNFERGNEENLSLGTDFTQWYEPQPRAGRDLFSQERHLELV